MFVLKLLKIGANEADYSWLKHMFIIKFLLTEMCKPGEIYRKMYMHRQIYLSPKIFTSILNIALPLKVENTVHGVENSTDSP